jgi:toxin ParE1/3/4
MTFRKAQAADRDLNRMYLEGSARFGMRRARLYWTEIHHVFELIGENPRLGRERAEFQPPVRVHVHASHVIVYRIEDDGIPTILRVRHSLEDWRGNPV